MIIEKIFRHLLEMASKKILLSMFINSVPVHHHFLDASRKIFKKYLNGHNSKKIFELRSSFKSHLTMFDEYFLNNSTICLNRFFEGGRKPKYEIHKSFFVCIFYKIRTNLYCNRWSYTPKILFFLWNQEHDSLVIEKFMFKFFLFLKKLFFKKLQNYKKCP